MRLIIVIIIVIVAVILTYAITTYCHQNPQWKSHWQNWAKSKTTSTNSHNKVGVLSQLKKLLEDTTKKYDQDHTYYDPYMIEEPKSNIDIKEDKKDSGKKKRRVHEERCREILEKIFQTEFPNSRPDWLRNYTGKKLEIDCYSEELKLGLEYNSEYHYVFPNVWQKTKEEFDDLQERDKLKIELCEENGVDLIVVPYTVKYKDLYSYIIQELENLGRIVIED